MYYKLTCDVPKGWSNDPKDLFCDDYERITDGFGLVDPVYVLNSAKGCVLIIESAGSLYTYNEYAVRLQKIVHPQTLEELLKHIINEDGREGPSDITWNNKELKLVEVHEKYIDEEGVDE